MAALPTHTDTQYPHATRKAGMSPMAARAGSDDDDTVPSQFRYQQGDDGKQDNGNPGGGSSGGGINADPNDWDVDSWGRGTIEVGPSPQPQTGGHEALVERWLDWMRSLVQAFEHELGPKR